MTKLNYSRNHSRSLSSKRAYHGDEVVFVSCLICSQRQPADGYNALRVETERGVKARMGYQGPSQVWLCRGCVENHGPVITRGLADEITRASHLDRDFGEIGPDGGHTEGEPPDNSVNEEARNFWRWALGAGAVAVLVAGAWASERMREE